ncbi:PREDICTED: uncharacterized protein LOC105522223 [Colobus angolensis palliatus]|uniref:uncharacterized protein LOC105522223 n=1 Tax=Colobus angolensis palliatus TaxID=336983 RepID=UPI0005F4A636|nr:PREDICTED: uncharacterized protein LOC105522223 [Colobus angolensis palliatus]
MDRMLWGTLRLDNSSSSHSWSLGDCRAATGLQDSCPPAALDKIPAQPKPSSTVRVLNTDLEDNCSVNTYQLFSDSRRALGIIVNFLRLREQPAAAPRPRSLCLGPPGARGPAQAGHAGTEEAERTGSDGETGEEPAKRHRHHHHQPPLPSPSLTVAHPSSPASPPISYPCAVPTLSDHLLFTRPQGRLTSQNKHSDRAPALLGSPAPEGMNLLRRSKTYKKQALKPSAFSLIG